MARMLRLLDFRGVSVSAGVLAVAAAPYSAFAGSRPLSDPLATLCWWAGIVLALSAVRPAFGPVRRWAYLAAAAALVGLAAHLRLNMLPAIALSSLCLVVYVLWSTLSVRVAAGTAALRLAASLPALASAAAASGASRSYNDSFAPMRAWTSTFYLGYDRWYVVDVSLPWKGDDPRPLLPAGWRDREDGEAADALIEGALRGADPDSVSLALGALGRDWRVRHPIAYNFELPLVRIVAAWVPLAPELWVRSSPYRLGQFVERSITLLGLLVLVGLMVARGRRERRGAAAVVGLCAFALPTLTILATQLAGTEFSDYRVHHAGWVPALAVGAASMCQLLVSLRNRRKGSVAA
jgi:hypothetical protein